MKKLFYNLLLFFLPLSFIPIIEAFFLPVSFFTYRSWEALSFYKMPARGPFYPNMTLSMQEQGDLAHHTNKTIVKNTLWVTDQIGYRNTQLIKDPDILLIGDSFFGGSSLSQTEILNSQLSEKLGHNVTVYNIAPNAFEAFDRFYQENILGKPKLIIFSVAERTIPPFFMPYNKKSYRMRIKYMSSYKNVNVVIDRMLRLYSTEWIRSRIKGNIGDGIVSPVNPAMFFSKGKSIPQHSVEDLENSVEAIASYKKYCDSLNIGFLFIPMPNKETVYYKFVPFSAQPDYLFRLDTLLKKAGVPTINTLKVYNDWIQSNSTMLYHLDDAHWNQAGVNLVADEIMKLTAIKAL